MDAFYYIGQIEDHINQLHSEVNSLKYQVEQLTAIINKRVIGNVANGKTKDIICD